MTPRDSTPTTVRLRRAAVAAGTAILLAVAGTVFLPSASTGAASSAAARPSGVVFKLSLDKRGRVRDGTVFKNEAGKGRARVELARGRFKLVKGKPGRALRYPGKRGYGLLEAPDRNAWDPRGRDFRFGVKVKVPGNQANKHINIIQKGYYRQAGGQWKLQVDRGLPSCLVRGDVDRVLVRGATDVADGRWHRLMCSRTAEHGVRLFVDGALAAENYSPTGTVANGAPLRIGAKKLGPGRVDQFHGRLDLPYLFVA